MSVIEDRTKVRFMSRTTEKNFVEIQSGDGFLSSVGCVGNGRQTVTLAAKVEYVQTIVHELLHTIGIHHEHSRPDRDLYVQVHWENIRGDQLFNFEVCDNNLDDNCEIHRPFDFNSVMLYGPCLFSVNGKPTLSAKINGLRLLHCYEKSPISDGDVNLVNSLYGKVDLN